MKLENVVIKVTEEMNSLISTSEKAEQRPSKTCSSIRIKKILAKIVHVNFSRTL